MTRKRYEYTVVIPEQIGFPDKTYTEYFTRILNEKGQEGWEFAGSSENRFYYYWIFKRDACDDTLREVEEA